MRRNKVLSFFMSIIMAFSMVTIFPAKMTTFSASYYEVKDQTGFVYRIYDDYAVAMGYGNTSISGLFNSLSFKGIYSYVEYVPVRYISGNALTFSNVKELIIPDTVIEILDGGIMGGAFAGTEISEVTIPKNVILIGANAFNGCKNLKAVYILNPDCEIRDFELYKDGMTISNSSDGFSGKIFGYKNSTAHEYAKKCGYNFVDIENSEILVTSTPKTQAVTTTSKARTSTTKKTTTTTKKATTTSRTTTKTTTPKKATTTTTTKKATTTSRTTTKTTTPKKATTTTTTKKATTTSRTTTKTTTPKKATTTTTTKKATTTSRTTTKTTTTTKKPTTITTTTTTMPITIPLVKDGVVFDETTSTLYLEGKVSSANLKEYKYNSKVKKVIAEEETILPRDSSGLFSGFKASTIDLSKADTSNVTDMNSMFMFCSNLMDLDISGFDTSNVTNMYGMFDGCKRLLSLNLNHFNTSNVTNMMDMFIDCTNLKELNIDNFDTSKVTTMSRMFYSCSNLQSLDLSSFDTSNVKNMSGMFMCCYRLANLNISSFNTANVNDMSQMFSLCTKLNSLILVGFDTSKVTNMELMFYSCSYLKSLNISSFNTSKVTNFKRMFDSCSGLTSLDLSSFDTSNVNQMTGMFLNCSELKKVVVSEKWTIKNVSDKSATIFTNSPFLTGGNGTKYNDDYISIEYACIDKNGSPGYFTASDDYLFFENTDITLTNGNQYTIPTTRNDLTYKSNNTDVAIVSPKGIITAIGEGSAIISVIESDWNAIQLYVTVNHATSSKPEQDLPGDSNMDNQVDLSDVVLIMQFLANPNKYGFSGTDRSHITEQGAANADVEGGNGVTANDALTIQRYLLKLISKLPV